MHTTPPVNAHSGPGIPRIAYLANRLGRPGDGIFACEDAEILRVGIHPPKGPGPLLGRKSAGEVDDEPRKIGLPAGRNARELLVAVGFGLSEKDRQARTELAGIAMAADQRERLALPALAILETQPGEALMVSDETPNARLLIVAQGPREIHEMLDHLRRLRPYAGFL